jgi:uncharacterized protein
VKRDSEESLRPTRASSSQPRPPLPQCAHQVSAPNPNPSAGTQIVSLIEIRGPNHSRVHPRGAVGILTRTPAVEGEKYLVRFPDGFESTLARDQFEILKHFKDRLGALPRSAGVPPASSGGILPPDNGAPVSDRAFPERAGSETGAPQDGHPDPGFDLEQFVIYRCVVGSRAYGLDTDASDTDRRGIYLAPADLHWSLFGAPEQFEDNTGQWCVWELQKFLIMALKANPNILECLYSPLVEKVTDLGAELLALRQQFLSQMIFQTFNGYALSQFKKIEQDRRNHGDRMARSARLKEEGKDTSRGPGGQLRWKHAMHLLRLLLTGAATLREGRVPVRVEAHRDRLLAVKRGELDWPEVDAWRQALHRDFEHALAETKLAERPDYEAANRFLIKARRESTKG